MNVDAFRLIAIIELALLLAGGAFIHTAYCPSLPRYVRVGGYAIFWVLLVTACSIALNMNNAIPVTPGIILFALLNLPATIVVMVSVSYGLRARTRSLRRAKKTAE